MEKSHYCPPDHWDWPIDLPYKPGVKCGNMIFVGGEAALDRNGEVVAPGDVVVQTRLVMENIEAVLQGFGATASDIVKINTFYVSSGTVEEWAESSKIRASYFSDPGPAATAIPVPHLAFPGLMIEIEAIAMVD